MTPNMQSLYERLVQHAENTCMLPDGTQWGTVYLGNCIDSRRDSGTLSALTKIGKYKAYNDGTDQNHFGQVLMP